MSGEIVLAYIGAVVPEREERNLRRFSQSLKMIQRFMLRALSQEGFKIDAIYSVRPVLHFPAQPELVYGLHRTRSDDGFSITLLPFVNLPFVKQLSLSLGLFPALVRFAWRQRKSRRAILMHNLFPAPVFVCWLAARLTRTPLFAVVADLHVPGSGSRASTLLNRLDFRQQTAALRRLDGAIVLTRNMTDDFAPDLPAIRMEGAVPPDATRFPVRALRIEDGRIVFVYSGALSPTKGTPLLLDAFRMLVGDRYQLWLTGDGESRGDVEEATRRDPRIRYFGFLPYEEVLELYQRATVLINPHATTVQSARYQFPSKLLEYLASARPVLSSVTPEIEAEYADVLLLVRGETAEALANAMRDAAGRSEQELADLGRRGRELVLREKTWERQGSRVAAFLRERVERHRQ